MNIPNGNFKELIQSDPETIIEELFVSHPQLAWEIVNRDETAYVDDDVSERLIGFVGEDALIFDLFSSECGRFAVKPEEAYGVPSNVAEVIKKYNNFV